MFWQTVLFWLGFVMIIAGMLAKITTPRTDDTEYEDKTVG